MTNVTWLDPAQHPAANAVRAWQTHLDARRLGNNPPIPAPALANLHATDALFRSFANPRPVWESRA